MKIKSVTADDGSRWTVRGWALDGTTVSALLEMSSETVGPIPSQGAAPDAMQDRVLALLGEAGKRGATGGDIQGVMGPRHRVRTGAAIDALLDAGLLVSARTARGSGTRYWLPENRPVSQRQIEERAHIERLARDIASKPDGADTVDYYRTDLAALRQMPGVRVFEDRIYVDPDLAGFTQAPALEVANPFSTDQPA